MAKLVELPRLSRIAAISDFSKRTYNFWLAQAGWPQSHSSFVSLFAA
jgi:hypothetical protein